MPETGPESALQATIDRLRAEVEGQRRAMRTRAVIEQAKGILVERLGCSPDQAFEHLTRLSQDANRKLVDLAADLVGSVAPPEADERPPAADEPPAVVGPPTAPRARVRRVEDHVLVPAPPGRGDPSAGEFAARYHVAASALSSAESPDELAALLMETALAPLGVGALAVTRLEPDGALRLVASNGVPAHQLSQWQRIPPQMSLPLTDAARRGATVWVHGRGEFTRRYPDLTGQDLVPGDTVCALPLRTGEQLIGAIKLGWPGTCTPTAHLRRHLSALARLCAGELLRVLALSPEGGGAPFPAGEPWFQAVLDALLDPVLILHAVRGADGTATGGTVTDLRVVHANAATVDLAGRTGAALTGRLLGELYPGMVASGTVRQLIEVAVTREPYLGAAEQFVEVVGGAVHGSTMTLRATPFLDGVLVSWRTHDEQERRETQLVQAQRLAGLGTWQWRVADDRFDCSPEVFRLLGLPRPARRGCLTAAEAESAVAPGDRQAVRRAARQLLDGERAAALEFRIVRPDGVGRRVRAMAEAVPGPIPGSPVLAVRGVVQDVTAWRRTEEALVATRSRLAEQVRRTADEHRAVLALQHALMDAAAGPPTPGLEVAARYLPAETEAKIGGDWYDALTLPDGTVLIVVGDVSGHGLRAAAGMAQVRDALRGMAFTGAEPARLLERLNQMLCHLGGGFIATAVCGLLDPAARTLTWARAGHLPPLLAHEGAARYLELLPGPVLGAVPHGVYRSTVLRLEPQDLVLLFTDGLIERRGEDLALGLDRLARAVEDYRVPGIDGCLDHVLRRLKAPNPRDDTCVVGLRLN
ncbi:SpoIIE family protein phosphatase [Kitasatospora sp. NBC_00240]|uniref:SpoIIE family protein phosphatase n=1 Tax=Kitasatospora sp. NBC_00240 TaxID=2903567 RepID=UPI00225922EA|nr:SpoIIE family protein phosphatase [Kitasatospora sp. NBC_00240]MCX5208511.1 SpoIIE family protein phosphatase [Kitasatospora sp. NBC_00240]